MHTHRPLDQAVYRHLVWGFLVRGFLVFGLVVLAFSNCVAGIFTKDLPALQLE